MSIEDPVSLRADSSSQFLADCHGCINRLPAVEDALVRGNPMEAYGAESLIHDLAGFFPCVVQVQCATGLVTLHMVPRPTTQQLVHRVFQQLTLDIPEGAVQGTECMNLLTAWGIKSSAVHSLPEVFRAQGVLTDERPGAIPDQVTGSPLADARDPRIGFHHHDNRAVVDPPANPAIVRGIVDTYPGDLQIRLGCVGRNHGKGPSSTGSHQCRFQESASFHTVVS